MRQLVPSVLLLCVASAPAGSAGPAFPAQPQGLEPQRLEMGTRTYTVFYEGNPVGEYVYSLQPETHAGRQVVRVSRRFTLPQGPVTQSALFDARTLEPLRSDSRGAITVDLEHASGRVRGTVQGVDSESRTMDAPLQDGALLPYMFEAVLSVLPLTLGYAETFSVVNPASATFERVGLRVVGEETITVPAGTFPVYRIEITGFEPETAYVLKSKPHVLVKQDMPSPVSIQLASTATSTPGR